MSTEIGLWQRLFPGSMIAGMKARLACIVIAFSLTGVSMNAQSPKPVTRLSPDSPLGRSQNTGLEYVLRINPDRLLAPCYEAMGRGREAKGLRYGGWESRQIAGHSLGHYLSALATFVEACGDTRAREKLIYTVNELARLQRDDGYLGGVPGSPFDRAFSGEFEVDGFSLGGYWVP